MYSLKKILISACLCAAVFSIHPAFSADALQEVATLLDEGSQLRAQEFAPETYEDARDAYNEAKRQISSGKSSRAVKTTSEARAKAQQAILIAQKVSNDFAELVEARDRMQLTGADKIRKDLGKRAEEAFDRVIEAMEGDNLSKAKSEAKLATKAVYAAELVASREQIIAPLSNRVAEARRVSARKYSPRSFDKALEAQKQATAIITDNPRARIKARNIAKLGEDHAMRSQLIAEKGMKFSRDEDQIEAWHDEQDSMLAKVGEALGVQLNPFTSPEQRLLSLQQAADDMKSSHKAQLQDAEMQIQQLAQQLEQTGSKLAKYEGDIAKFQGELAGREADMAAMAEMRLKLQAKRDAEAKIKRIAGLFDKEKVEILLTTDADVILRMKGLNFRSGSSVLPPDGYGLLDNILTVVDIFPNRSVRIEGHTDFIGSNLYNQGLSERRARAVEEYFLSRVESIVPNQFNAVGYGEDRPIANNETEEGRKRNRRIDIVLPAPTL